MATDNLRHFLAFSCMLVLLAQTTHAADIFLNWNVSSDISIRPVNSNQHVITINGMFPGPLIDLTTDDNIYVNIFNNLDEPFLMTWNGIQQRANSWQDGVSGTNCPINPGTNWTYAFQVNDQIGSFFYFPSTRFQKAGGGFGPIRVNNKEGVSVPFGKPDGEFDLLIGDWNYISYQINRVVTKLLQTRPVNPNEMYILINGKAPYKNSWGIPHETIEMEQGKTYRLRISNTGSSLSFNFRIQNHQMILVETEGSYTNQIAIDSLDVHVGQSYSVLVHAYQPISDYYIVATPTQVDASNISNPNGIAVLHYKSSSTQPTGLLPMGPEPLNQDFSVNQAKSIRLNMTTGAASSNPQGRFNVTKVKISQTFILESSHVFIRYNYFTVNNVSYLTPTTPLKLADYVMNGAGVYQLNAFPVNSTDTAMVGGTFVASGIYKGWVEIVFLNKHLDMNSWHLDGYGFYVVGFGNGEWSPTSRETYNLFDPIIRSTVQVYPKGWSAVYVYLDNLGMWNLRSQILKNWYLGQELYLRVHDSDPDQAKKEQYPPANLLQCGIFDAAAPAPVPAAPVSLSR